MAYLQHYWAVPGLEPESTLSGRHSRASLEEHATGSSLVGLTWTTSNHLRWRFGGSLFELQLLNDESVRAS